MRSPPASSASARKRGEKQCSHTGVPNVVYYRKNEKLWGLKRTDEKKEGETPTKIGGEGRCTKKGREEDARAFRQTVDQLPEGTWPGEEGVEEGGDKQESEDWFVGKMPLPSHGKGRARPGYEDGEIKRS